MSAMFEFTGGGIGIMPDPADNPDRHDVPDHNAGVQISEEVANVGDANGVATIGVEVDNTFVTNWTSDPLDPGQSQALSVSLGRFPAGPHTILVFLNPGSGKKDNETNDINLP